MKEDINDEIIIGYLNKTLSKVDRISFEKEMETNDVLAKRFEFLKNVAIATQINAEANFRDKIIGVETKLKNENFFNEQLPKDVANSSKPSSKLKYVILVLELIAIIGLLFINNQCSDTSIASKAMADEKMRNYTTRNVAQTIDVEVKSYQSALRYYHRGETEKSKDLFDKIDVYAPTYHDAQYALALISFENGKYDEARKIASTLLADNCEIKDKAGWLHLNASIAMSGYHPTLIESYIKTTPKKFYLKKAEALQLKMDAPIRSLVLFK